MKIRALTGLLTAGALLVAAACSSGPTTVAQPGPAGTVTLAPTTVTSEVTRTERAVASTVVTTVATVTAPDPDPDTNEAKLIDHKADLDVPLNLPAGFVVRNVGKEGVSNLIDIPDAKMTAHMLYRSDLTADLGPSTLDDVSTKWFDDTTTKKGAQVTEPLTYAAPGGPRKITLKDVVSAATTEQQLVAAYYTIDGGQELTLLGALVDSKGGQVIFDVSVRGAVDAAAEQQLALKFLLLARSIGDALANA